MQRIICFLLAFCPTHNNVKAFNQQLIKHVQNNFQDLVKAIEAKPELTPDLEKKMLEAIDAYLSESKFVEKEKE